MEEGGKEGERGRERREKERRRGRKEGREGEGERKEGRKDRKRYCCVCVLVSTPHTHCEDLITVFNLTMELGNVATLIYI